jgi:hypothetical protein
MKRSFLFQLSYFTHVDNVVLLKIIKSYSKHRENSPLNDLQKSPLRMEKTSISRDYILL